MSKTILAQLDGFTPVIDGMIPDVGLMCAVVFGKVHRYCQMPEGVCKASQERLSKELGIERRTVMQHLETLVSHGYLKVKKEFGKPNTYIDTGKANLYIKVTGGVIKSDRGCQLNGQVPVRKSDTKKEVKKDIKKEVRDSEILDYEIDPIQRMFEVELGIMPSISDIKAMDEFKKMGATIEDLREGIKWRVEKNNSPIRSYQAVIEPTRTAMLKRTQKNKFKPKDPEYREVYD